MKYEFLISGLPELKQGSLLSTEALSELLEEQLSARDRKLWKSLLQDRCAEAPSGLPQAEPAEGQMIVEMAETCKNPFLKEWFAFNRDLNNVLTAAICRKHNLDLRKQIKVESESESERLGVYSVAQQILANPNAKDFGLTGTMPIVDEILAIANIENLLERERAIDAIRQAWLEEKTLFLDFDIEKVLSYWLQNEILHRWDALTMETGQRVFRELVAEMKKSIKI